VKKPFLESLAEFLLSAENGGLENTWILLPNRRAGIFLQQHLARRSQVVGWMPEILTISDFVTRFSELEAAEPADLVVELYLIYSRLKDRAEDLDEFWYWGELMLADFDEVDKYRVEAADLFRNIRDLKEIEEPLAGLEETQIRFIRQFWEGFLAGSPSAEKTHFLDTWELLPGLYRELKESLRNAGKGYPGMQYRELADKIREGKLDDPPWNRIIVAGFNALNVCEEAIFGWLKAEGAFFFWDYDRKYTLDKDHEAGRFMRENLTAFPPSHGLENFSELDGKKDFRIFELPSDVMQAKTLQRILEESDPQLRKEATDTAVVLCDETLMMPVLLSLPAEETEVNITMGYPLSMSTLAGFVDALLRMQQNIRGGDSGEERFYFRDVQAILQHPYMTPGGSVIHPLLSELSHENLIYVDGSRFRQDLEQSIFQSYDSPSGMIRYFRTIFVMLLDQMSDDPTPSFPEVHREFLLRLLLQMNKLEMQFQRLHGLTLTIAQSLFRRILASLRIPFEGEPLSGLQLMGILETRLLDFRHVILLSMNEEIMPASRARQSFIPYSLRLAFGLPSREDMDAIYAYYFNRLLQRARKVDLLYNSTSEGVRTGEMSRYLYQLMFEHSIQPIRPGLEVLAREIEPITMDHGPEVQAYLSRFQESSEDGSFLSPSALNTYMDCPLKFYLRYVAGIGEADEVKEEMDAAGFGTVVHDSLKVLYSEIAGKNGGEIGKEGLEDLLRSNRLEEVLQEEFLKEFSPGRKDQPLEGRNIVLSRIMVRILRKIVETDLSYAPFQLLSAEESYSRNLEIKAGEQTMQIRLGGKIDRVDRVHGKIRVIDYKTGSTRTDFPSIESLFDPGFSNRNGAALQTMLYAWLASPGYPDEPVSPGLYVIRSLYDKGFNPALVIGKQREKQEVDSFSLFEESFLEGLCSALSSLYDPAIPFAQTRDEQHCGYCDYAGICSRNLIE
jgi:CRISPR/Cas system-associated exonuclease Cas4 (RecB family)